MFQTNYDNSLGNSINTPKEGKDRVAQKGKYREDRESTVGINIIPFFRKASLQIHKYVLFILTEVDYAPLTLSFSHFLIGKYREPIPMGPVFEPSFLDLLRALK